MTRTSYRVLLARTGGPLGDQVAVGLIHWDGSTLRTRFEPERARSLSGDPSAVVGAIHAWREKARNTSSEPALLRELDQVFPVPKGVGSALLWSERRVARPSHAEAHFDDLCRRLRLRAEDEEAQRRMTTEELKAGLRSLGQRLAEKHGDRVRVDQPTSAPLPYRPPLSWKNGRWHHAVPVWLDASEREQLNRAHTTAGRLEAGIPSDEPALLLAWLPVGEGRASAERVAKQLAATRAQVDITLFDASSEDPFAELEARIERDLAAVA